METNDRIDFLKHLNENIFNKYIPDHYNEVHAFYCLLDSLGIDYNNINFQDPKATETTFSFLCDFMNENDLKKLKDVLTKSSKIKYNRNNEFSVSLKEGDHVQIKFKKS